MSQIEIDRRNEYLHDLDTDAYIEEVVEAANDQSRTPAPQIIEKLGQVVSSDSEGPYFEATVRLDFGNGDLRLVGFVAQDRSRDLGSWMPQHHLRAARFAEHCSNRAYPVVSFMDTPGADAKEEANANNQAHSISRLIAEMSNLDVPSLGVIYGLGYSGGAIPRSLST